jgi:tRNA(Phe) wybutosine-synthesizing methylase Tyw3
VLLTTGGIKQLVLQSKDSINYLLRRKFGSLAPPPVRSTSGLGSIRIPPQTQGHYESIEQYRNELTALSPEDFNSLYEAERAREAQLYLEKRRADEDARPFNQPWANLDVDYWSKISFWTLEEAVAISLNKDPRRVKWDSLKSITNVSDFAAKFEAKLMLVERAKEMGQLWAKTTPSVFLAWAKRTRFEMPVELVETAKSLGVQVADWKTYYDEQVKVAEAARAEIRALNEKSISTSQEYIAFIDQMSATQKEIDKTQNDRMNLLKQQLSEAIKKIEALELERKPKTTPTSELNPRVKDTLLKMIIAMATDNYGYVPSQLRSPFPKELSDLLVARGLDVTDETIRKYLKEAAELLPPLQSE